MWFMTCPPLWPGQGPSLYPDLVSIVSSHDIFVMVWPGLCCVVTWPLSCHDLVSIMIWPDSPPLSWPGFCRDRASVVTGPLSWPGLCRDLASVVTGPLSWPGLCRGLFRDLSFVSWILEFEFVFLQVERAEKERMKRVVLGIHERQEEEDYQGNPVRPLTFGFLVGMFIKIHICLFFCIWIFYLTLFRFSSCMQKYFKMI